MSLTVLKGSTFCVCDERGDIGSEAASGFFAIDMRYLSAFHLTVDGARPRLLSKKVDYFSAIFGASWNVRVEGGRVSVERS